jgi:EAL domain-containing protein (putative c-di-GMP-specific phosphodiesterase class I)
MSGSIIQTIVTLANRLEIQVIAEGIETPAQLAWLRKIGVGCGQGYHFAKPLDADAIEQMLHDCNHPPRALVA